MTADVSIEGLLDEICSGDKTRCKAAQDQLVNLYFAKLTRWAERRLHPSLRSYLDPEAVANSVCRSVLRRTEFVPTFAGYLLTNPDRVLFRLLMQKLSDAGAELLCLRRDARRTRRASEMAPEDSPFVPGNESEPRADTPWLDVAWEDALKTLKQDLGERDKYIVDHLIDGRSLEEIGAELGISGRAIGQRVGRNILPAAWRCWPEHCESNAPRE